MTHGDVVRTVQAYFTRFDRGLFADADWHREDLAAYEMELELDLKLLALTKGRVIVAASHLLESELARELLLRHQEIVGKGIVIPALRADCGNVEVFLERKLESSERRLYEGSQVRAVAQLLSSDAKDIVAWDPAATQGWFRRRLDSELEDDKSVLRSHLMDVAAERIDAVKRRLADEPDASRGVVLRVAREEFGKPHSAFTDYIDFLYYLAGAMAVHSEGVFPQENLVRFDGAASGGSVRLDELYIFERIFLQLVRNHHRSLFPEGLLGAIDFADISALRGSPSHVEFVEKYDRVVRRAKERVDIADVTGLVLHLGELEEAEWELRREFAATIGSEVKQLVRGKKADTVGRFVSNVSSLILDPYSTLSSAAGAMANGLTLLGGDDLLRGLAERRDRLLHRLNGIVDRRPAQERPILMQFLRVARHRYEENSVLP